MKRKIIVAISLLLLLTFLLPIQATAFGGFVSLKGSSTYHEIYCDLMEGYSIDELRWFDTSEQAESAGLRPCEECDAANGFDFQYDLETNWKTSNHLLQSAMEIEYEIGCSDGYHEGYEVGYSDAECGYEYSLDDYYDLGYEEGYEDGRKEAFDDNNNSSYDGGYKASNRITQEDVEELIAAERKDASSDAYLVSFFLGFPLCLGICIFVVGSFNKANEFLKEKASNQ